MKSGMSKRCTQRTAFKRIHIRFVRRKSKIFPIIFNLFHSLTFRRTLFFIRKQKKKKWIKQNWEKWIDNKEIDAQLLGTVCYVRINNCVFKRLKHSQMHAVCRWRTYEWFSSKVRKQNKKNVFGCLSFSLCFIYSIWFVNKISTHSNASVEYVGSSFEQVISSHTSISAFTKLYLYTIYFFLPEKSRQIDLVDVINMWKRTPMQLKNHKYLWPNMVRSCNDESLRWPLANTHLHSLTLTRTHMVRHATIECDLIWKICSNDVL